MIELRPYQQAVQDEVFDHWRAGTRNVMAVKPTGAGKSVLISDTVRKFDANRQQTLVMAHRRELVGQMSLHVARQGVRHRIIGPKDVVATVMAEHRRELNGNCFVNPSALCAVGGVDTIMSRRDQLDTYLRSIDLLVCDECFPAGTMIRTPSGEKPIELLSIGDQVIAFDDQSGGFHIRKVARLFRNPMPKSMVRLYVRRHHVITATLGHPFWTQRGWVNAGELKADDCIMYYVRETGIDGPSVSTRSVQENRSSVLQQGLRPAISDQSVIGDHESDKSSVCIGANDEPKPDAAHSCSGEGFRQLTENQSSTAGSGRKRQEYSATGNGSTDHVHAARLRSAILSADRNDTRVRVCDELQTGLRTSDFENSIGSGWDVTSVQETSISGREERRISYWQRLDCVEIFQPSDYDRSNLCLGDGYVYNIEVEDLHTYVANDIVVHNCHHVLTENKWGSVFDLCTRALGLGVTATPQRADGKGLGRHADGVFDAMVIGPSMRELIDMGNLTDYEIVCPPTDFDMSKLREGAEDFTQASLKEASDNSPKLVGDVVENYCKYAFGKRAVVFATDVATSTRIAEQFNAWGIPAASVSAQTDSGVRDDIMRRLRDGRLWVVVNVDLLGEGVDVPAIDVVIMARPTASLAVYMQQFGRALRINPANPIKIALVIDHVSNIKRFGFPDRPRVWTLDRRQKRAAKEKDPELIDVLVCPETGRPYEAIHIAACPHCGQSHIPIREGGSGRVVEMVAGDLTKLSAEDLAALRAAIELPDPETVADPRWSGGIQAGQRNIAYARLQARQELKDALAEWAGFQRHGRGRDDSEIYRRFYAATGIDIASALGASRADMIAMTERIKGWLTTAA